MGRSPSRYQQGIIKRYYHHLDTIMLNRLQELVTELYLAQNTTGEDRLWRRVEKALIKLKIAPELVEHLMQKRQVELLAAHLTDWLRQQSG